MNTNVNSEVAVKTVVDSKRGCGWRKEGGLYLRADGLHQPCGKLPLPLTVCPCCHAGIKPSRGWTWIAPRPLFAAVECLNDPKACLSCVLSNPPERAGLLWIGEKFYPKPSDWIKEAHRLGVSRRISAVPKDFKIGQTWVFAAHIHAIDHKELCACRCTVGKDCGTCHGEGWVHSFSPAIFHVFRPSRIEYVTKGNETPDQLKALAERGITPVKVQREGELIPDSQPLEK